MATKILSRFRILKNEYAFSMDTKTQTYMQKLNDKGISVVPIEPYITLRTAIVHLYPCGHKNILRPASVYIGNGCRKCADIESSKRNMTPKEDFLKKLYNLRDDVEVLSEYTGMSKPVKVLFKKCGHVVERVYPTSLMANVGCRKCRGYYKTHEEFISKAKEIHPDVKVLGKYINSSTPILFECLICGNKWDKLPYAFEKSNGCPKCAHKNRGLNSRKTHEEYLLELKKVTDSIIPIEEYDGINTSIFHKCLVCGNEWKSQPSNILNGYGCRKCNVKKSANKKKKQYADAYIDKLKEKNPTIYPLEKYTSSKRKIAHKCLVCGNIFPMKPEKALEGSKCPECTKKETILKRTKTNDEFIKEVAANNPNVDIIGEYTNSKINILVKCKICGNTWYGNPSNLLKGRGCRKCASVKRGLNCRKSEEQYKEELATKYPNIVLLEEYTGANTETLHYCSICNRKFYSQPSNVLIYGCSTCIKPYKGENIIQNFLNDNNINYIHPYRFPDLRGKSRPLSYDFYLPDHNLLIEFQGEQHEHPIEYFGGEEQFKIQQDHDRKKREYAKSHLIKLLEIWYYNQDNIEKILTKELKLNTAETAG